MRFKHSVCLLLALFLTACGTQNNYAPVAESNWQPWSRYQNTHRVVKGETLYAIAFRYDTDYRRLAELNHLRYPYALRVGQVINVRGAARPVVRQNRSAYVPKYSRPLPTKSAKVYTMPWSRPASGHWLWPASGRVVTGFSPSQGKKGINIACVKGQKVRAASGGVVAYAGNGLTGYGNLIIIKHDNQYLTAYSNSRRNLVSEGQRVKQGQVIAEVGVLDRKYWGVHFEIRKAGQPVNPMSYLK